MPLGFVIVSIGLAANHTEECIDFLIISDAVRNKKEFNVSQGGGAHLRDNTVIP